jgi:hypothetical protein
MMRPINKKELQKNLRKIEDEEEKEAYQHWYDNTENIVENEASLTYWKDDLHLKFKPSTEGETERDGELHGTFEACVVTEDGHKRVMEVADDWVKNNISEDARTLVIRASQEMIQTHVNKDGRMETGYLALENDSGEYEFKLDEHQISMIRYLPQKSIKDSKGREVIKPERWRGLIKTNDEPDEFVDLEKEWVEENISNSLQEFIKKI